MKMRTDYVSNSSSSSFVICGKVFDFDDVLKCLDEKTRRSFDACEIDKYEVIDKLTEAFEEDGLDVETAGYDDIEEVLIGKSPERMLGSQTLDGFKAEIIDALKHVKLKAARKDIHFVSGGSDPCGLNFFGCCG